MPASVFDTSCSGRLSPSASWTGQDDSIHPSCASPTDLLPLLFEEADDFMYRGSRPYHRLFLPILQNPIGNF